MDFLDFDGVDLYFDEPMDDEVQGLLQRAADGYASGESEPHLMRAYFLAPHNLSVLVALYRYYYYQHRLEDALLVAMRALSASGASLGLPDDWRFLSEKHIGFAAAKSMGLLRFYLLALKGAAYLNLRCGALDMGRGMLGKIVEVDPKDHLGAGALLEVIEEMDRQSEASGWACAS